MSPEIEALKHVYTEINRNDIAAAFQFFDPDVERVEPEGFPTSGTYRGRSEVFTHITQGRSTWAEGRCEPEHFVTVGDRIVVYLYVHVRLHNTSDWLEARFADGFIFRDGKIVYWKSFGERLEALDWAGAKATIGVL